jgi:hypothetical protein
MFHCLGLLVGFRLGGDWDVLFGWSSLLVRSTQQEDPLKSGFSIRIGLFQNEEYICKLSAGTTLHTISPSLLTFTLRSLDRRFCYETIILVIRLRKWFVRWLVHFSHLVTREWGGGGDVARCFDTVIGSNIQLQNPSSFSSFIRARVQASTSTSCKGLVWSYTTGSYQLPRYQEL